MDKEERQKLFEMHGTIQRLDQKIDDIVETQGQLKERVRKIDEDVAATEKKTHRNRRHIYAIYTVASVLLALVAAAGNYVSTILG